MASEWIPVTERLPEDGQEVIVAWEGGVSAGEYSSSERLGFYYCYAEEERQFSGVTHWMPLPDPPGAEATREAAEVHPQVWDWMAEAALDGSGMPLDRDW